ncbi:MAG: hypothetical protein ACLFPJ_04585 [Candidatus Woesearchaeota archaeon]
MIFKKCFRCNKFLLFTKKKEIKNKLYCENCYNITKQENENIIKKKEEYLKKRQEEKKQRKKINEILANKKLKQEIEKQKIKQKLKTKKALLKKYSDDNDKEDKNLVIENDKKDNQFTRKIKTKKQPFTIEEIKNNNKLLYISTDVKRINVIEWVNSKKRICLNKEREIRRTHAGGFSQEKFQKFVEFKKEQTIDWIINLLHRPGVLKLPYDLIKIEANSELKEKIRQELIKLNENQKII